MQIDIPLIDWCCPHCGPHVPMRWEEFPLHCRCGHVDEGPEGPDPDPIGDMNRCDVLFLLNTSRPDWRETKGMHLVEILRDACIGAMIHSLCQAKESRIRRVIQQQRPRLVVNRAMLINAATWGLLARDFPESQFVTVNHSSQSAMMQSPMWLSSQIAHLRLAASQPNCWFASPDERITDILPAWRDAIVWMPNAIRIPDTAPPPTENDEPVISLICASRQLKNLPNQILAAGLAHRHYPLRLLLSTPGLSRELQDACAAAAGINDRIDRRPWGNHDEYVGRLSRVDVGLQASFTESFNYVGLEHLVRGRPVIGSPAIRYLPPEWRANPDDPTDIADRLVCVMADLDSQSDRAREIGVAYAQQTNEAFIAAITRLLS